MTLPVHHPGPVREQRICAVRGTHHTRQITLEAHTPIMAALASAVARLSAEAGITAGSAYVEFLAGDLETVSWSFPASGTPKEPMSYGPHLSDADVRIVTGSGVVGSRVTAHGYEDWSHIHMLWLDRQGRQHAGHLWPETVIGAGGLTVRLSLLEGIDMVNTVDSETGLPMFFPSPAEHAPAAAARQANGFTSGEVVVARIAPNVEIHVAVEAVLIEAGWSCGTIRAGTGSLVGTTFAGQQAPGDFTVPGPAVEALYLRGVLTHGRCEELHTAVIGAAGAVVSGKLQPTGNLVGATYELIIERSEGEQ